MVPFAREPVRCCVEVGGGHGAGEVKGVSSSPPKIKLIQLRVLVKQQLYDVAEKILLKSFSIKVLHVFVRIGN